MGLSPFESLARAAGEKPLAAALVLGSGMSQLGECLRVVARVPFAEVPGLSSPSVAGHKGTLALGDWVGRRVLVFEGRLHRYEGHSWQDVVAPVHVAYSLGAATLFLTNAAGGIHDALGPGSLMLLCDHIEWTWPYCWRRPGRGGLGGERPSPYSPGLLPVLIQAAHARRIALHLGVYAAVTGPCYESPAEIRALKAWGADAVGMSTAREVQQGFELGMQCAAVSCITNRAAGLSAAPLDHEEVLETARAQADKLAALVEEFLQRL